MAVLLLAGFMASVPAAASPAAASPARGGLVRWNGSAWKAMPSLSFTGSALAVRMLAGAKALGSAGSAGSAKRLGRPVTPHVSGPWGSAEEVPGSAALDAGGDAGVASISCPSAGDCEAGGFIGKSANNPLPLVVSSTGGVWGSAAVLPGSAALNTTGGMAILSISCVSPGNCGAGGLFDSPTSGDTNAGQAFVASEVNGVWHDPLAVAGSLNAGDDAQIGSVSCASAGNCAAVGFYTDNSGNVQPFIVDEAGGSWGAAHEVQAAGDAAAVITVSCASAGNCSAGGQLARNSDLTTQAFVVDEAHGVWGSAQLLPSTETLNAGGSAQFNSVSCPSAGRCTATGNYTDASGNSQVLVVNENGGAWGTAGELTGSAALNTSGSATGSVVSCPSPGNCGLGGAYDLVISGSGDPQSGEAFVASQVNGTWRAAQEMPGSAVVNQQGAALIDTMSCPSAGNCGAGGFGDSTGANGQAFVISEVDGNWQAAQEVPGLAQLNKGTTTIATAVSCGSAGSCNAGGIYTDGSGLSQAFVTGKPGKTDCLQSVAFGAYLATAESGSCFIKNGATYSDSGPVNLNGVDLIPNSGVIALDTTHGSEKLNAADANVLIGGFKVYSGPISVNLNGAFELKISATAQIGQLPLSGSLDVKVSGSDGLGIKGKVKLPKPLGGGAVALTIDVDTANGLRDASIEASNFTIAVKSVKIGLKDFRQSYNHPHDSWTGKLTVGLPTPSGQVGGEIGITHGKLAMFRVGSSGLNVALADGVFLQDISAGFVLDPPPQSFGGSVGITAGPAIKGVSAISVSGTLTFIFSNPADFQVKGTVGLLKGSRFGQDLLGGELDYYTNGFITASGLAQFSLGSASIKATMDGWVSGIKAFSLTGSGQVKVGKWSIRGSAVISSLGIAACGQPFGAKGPSIGFGYLWGGRVDIMGSSCGLGPYGSDVASQVSQPATSRAMTITLPARLPVASFKITGKKGAAPSGELTEPNGHKITVKPADQGLFAGSSPKYGVAADGTNGIDYVVIDAPAAGKWMFTPATGSKVTSIASADGLRAPRITAAVSAKGLLRTLSWKISGLDGRQVTFAEQGTRVHAILASGITASKGRFSFTPSDGMAGTRSIIATVTLNGLPTQTTSVARYSAPATSSVQVTIVDGKKASGKITITPARRTCRATSACTVTVATGQTVTLTPVPAHGSRFAWTAGLCAGTGPCQARP